MFSKDIEKLKIESQSIDCEIITISTLSNELFNNFPTITKEFLNIEIDTLQILDYKDFIKSYDNNKFSTPLDLPFLFREKEKEELFSLLDNNKIVLVNGNAGIGKTKFSIEVLNSYAQKNNFKFKAILNRGVNIFDDIKAYFNDEGKFLILIDDINRVYNAFNYIIKYFGEKIKNGNIKIVGTVRSYAKDNVLNNIPKELNTAIFELNKFQDKELKELIQKIYDIKNPIYLDRIVEVSNGNPRLALMASKVLKESNNLTLLDDAINIYDEYFKSIENDIFSQNETLIKTVIAISFFRYVDKLIKSKWEK